MRELGLIGLSEDRRFLVAHDALTDESFHIPTDIRLTSLLDASSAGTAKLSDREAGTREPTMEATLSPRDIQARIRRGESPDQVAESSGMPVEKVRGFAVPVIAEREFIVEQARKTSVRRLHATGTPGLVLGSLVDTSIAERGSAPDDATWDSWRREDGRWTVVVSPAGSDETATFLFDTKGRYVLPADDSAHALIGDVVAALDEPESRVEDVEADDSVETSQSYAVFGEVVVTEEVTEEIVLDVDIVEETIAEEPEEEVAEAGEPAAQVSSLKEARDRRALEQLALSVDERSEIPEELADVEITERQDVAVPATPHPSKKRHERRRVPSWDEIMFGNSHD